MRRRVVAAMVAVACAIVAATLSGIDNARLLGPRAQAIPRTVVVGSPAELSGTRITVTRFEVAESFAPKAGQSARPTALPGAVLVVAFLHVDHGVNDPKKGYCTVEAVQVQPVQRSWGTVASSVLAGIDRPKGNNCSGESREVDFAVAFEIPADAATYVRLRLTHRGDTVDFAR